LPFIHWQRCTAPKMAGFPRVHAVGRRQWMFVARQFRAIVKAALTTWAGPSTPVRGTVVSGLTAHFVPTAEFAADKGKHIEKQESHSMHESIYSVSDILSEPSGDELLRLLASVYNGVHNEESLRREVAESALEQGMRLGLLKYHKAGQLVLTSQGYFVGNVAKEYIHWLNNGRQMAPPRPPDEFTRGKDVLDLGCSFGRWLWWFQKNAKSALGLEMQQEYLELGRALAKREGIPCPEIRQGSVEELSSHVADHSVDFVFIRLVLNHVYVGKTLLQISNVLRPGGIVWAHVYPWYSPFQSLLRRDKGRELRHMFFAAFGIMNSFAFMITHRQMSLRVQGRMHSVHKPVYLTLKAWKAAFSRAGLCDFREIQSNVFWARKLGKSSYCIQPKTSVL